VGLTDGQLLECFATRGGEASELAFAALVERHGPMVLRTCRAVLRDEHDARDAFQATFLILVRRGGSLWVNDSVGPWLHGVACRASARARRDAARRRAAEKRAAEMSGRSADDSGWDDLAGLLHEEVDRLPDRYREPVVLCDLEGRTHEEAARHLGCPVGTVKSRLARGRERLRARLTRRGLAPEAALATLGPVTVPASLANATIGAAVRYATVGAAAAGAVPTAVVALTEGVSRSMLMTSLRTTFLFPLAVVTALGGLATGGVLLAQQRTEEKPAPVPTARSEPPAPAPKEQAASYAWRRTDTYEPPDFDRFFPDDPEGGKALDALWNDPNKDQRPNSRLGTGPIRAYPFRQP
jgi:RNA polymerase sigma factor (sigma-70 family)